MNPWFRFYAKFITDPDIEEMAFEDQRHFVFLLCMKCNGLLDKDFNGDLEKRERAISRRLGLQGEALVFAKERLVAARLIDDQWQPRSWDRLQRRSDRDPTGKDRQHRYRQRTRNALRNGDVTVLEQNRTEQKKSNCSSGDERFADFWNAYPRKVGKLKALSAWISKKLDDKADEIIEHLRIRVAQDSQWLESRTLIPHPTTFLNRGGWLDEYEKAPTTRPYL